MQANASSLAFNATEPGFAPDSVAPLLQGDFAGAYAAGVASPFVGLVNGTAAGGRTLPQLIANVSDGQVTTAVGARTCTPCNIIGLCMYGSTGDCLLQSVGERLLAGWLLSTSSVCGAVHK